MGKGKSKKDEKDTPGLLIIFISIILIGVFGPFFWDSILKYYLWINSDYFLVTGKNTTLPPSTPNPCIYDTNRTNIPKNFKWYFDDREWTWNIQISLGIYEYYKNIDRTYSDYSIYAKDPCDDDIINSLASSFERSNIPKHKLPRLVISFVQSLPYVSDIDSTGTEEYPKYPIETLVDGFGDCEDTSILVASLLKALNYSVVLLHYPGHMAVGVWGEESISGSYYIYEEKRYYYLETTETSWTIGRIPEEYKEIVPEIYPIS